MKTHELETPPRRILVAEDNRLNQQLAKAILEKRGHRVTLVETGTAAVEASASGEFDIILMDVQMPEMDGLDATRAIRAREGSDARMPIVALTAHAMDGDRQRCLDAGMDDYATKPFDAAALLATIDRLTRPDATDEPEPPESAPDSGGALPDTTPPTRAEIREAVGGDDDLVDQLAEIWQSDGVGMVEAVRTAVLARDAASLRTAAHTLKGAALALGARNLGEAARRLEQMGASGDVDPSADEVMLRLGQAAHKLGNVLR